MDETRGRKTMLDVITPSENFVRALSGFLREVKHKDGNSHVQKMLKS
jgi:hypothetical protein